MGLWFPGLWIGYADNAASNPATGIADRLAAVIRLGMHNNPTAEDRIFRASDSDIRHGDFIVSFASSVGLHISQVPSMALSMVWQAVWMAFGIVMAAGAGRVRD